MVLKRGEKGDRNIHLLGTASLFNDAGSEMITPMIPYFISSIDGGGVALGLIAGLREGLSSLIKIFGGWFSDKIGKRTPFVFIGYFLSILFKFLLGFAGSWQALVSFVSLERFGKLRDAPRDAIISDSTKKRGRGFGIQQMFDTSGGIIGSLLVLFLFWKLELSISTIIFVAAGITAFSLIPLFFVKEPRFKKIHTGLFSGIKQISGRLKYLILVIGIFTLANFGWYFFLIEKLIEITNSRIIPILVYVLFNIVFALTAIPFGKLSDRIGRKKVLLIGYFLAIIVSLGFAFIEGLVWLSLFFMLYGVVYAIVNSVQRAYVADLSGAMKGTSLGFYYFVIGLINIPAGFVAGTLWDLNPSAMFFYIAFITGLAFVMMLFVRE